MTLLIHVVIALVSVGYTTYLYINPSKSKLRLTYALTAATLTSGFFLVIITPAHMVHACITGLFYIGIISFGIVSAHYKLAKQNINNTN